MNRVVANCLVVRRLVLLRCCTSRMAASHLKRKPRFAAHWCATALRLGCGRGFIGQTASGDKSVMGKVVLFLGVVIGAAIFAVALIGAPAGESLAAREAQPAISAGCHVE